MCLQAFPSKLFTLHDVCNNKALECSNCRLHILIFGNKKNISA